MKRSIEGRQIAVDLDQVDFSPDEQDSSRIDVTRDSLEAMQEYEGP